ncbi:hypothetical protein KKF61_05400 [Patescibacteria group bacterium]|nr:hypothetical protein [Patescibacteria group bacterium]MBU0964411.1 hypothetical protein [Patescibacteria group bacterium]
MRWITTLEKTLANSSKNRKLRQEGLLFPSAQTWFITDECTKHCAGCPNADGKLDGDMSEDDWVALGQESIKFGCMIAMILGGEPMLKKEMVKRIKQRLGNQMLFLVFTNGDLITDQDMQDFRRLGIALAVNIGSGRKSDDGALRTLQLAKKHGVMAGASITITQQNYKQVTSQAYMDWLVLQGALFAFHFHYVPTGCDADQRFTLQGDTFYDVERRLIALRGPIRVIHYSQCRAAHALASVDLDGNVKLCAFCGGKKSVGNVLGSSMLDVFNNDRFGQLRRLNKGQACMVLQHTDRLGELGYLPAKTVQAVNQCQYPRGYIRRPGWWHELSVRLRDWAWAR